MIEQLFIQIINMSLTGSIVILAVLLIRFLIKKAPRIFSYCLWAVVLFRLLCPVSFTAAFSLFAMLKTPSAAQGRLEYIPRSLVRHPQMNALLPAADHGIETELIPAETAAPEVPALSHTEWIFHIAAVLWLLGIAVLMFYNLWNLYKLKRNLKTASWEKENIYLSHQVVTPFVIGLIRPRIYLPSHLEAEEKAYVLLHEQIHLRRKDHIIKFISYLALCLHWFNPFVWAAFFLSGKDMEMSCDEAVIRRIGSSVKKQYSCSLLSMATGKNILSGAPLAFGEGDTSSRIKNILRYKKPAAIVVKGAALLCGIAAIVLLANPDVGAKAGQTPSSLQDPAASSKRNLSQSASNASANTAANPQPSYPSADSNASDSADTAANPQFSGQPADSVSDLTEVFVQSIAKDARIIDSYVLPFNSPLEEGNNLPFADDCQFLINNSMNSWDLREASYDLFASLMQSGGKYITKPCLFRFENGRIVRAVLKSAWSHYGITPLADIPYASFYESVLESEGEDAFYNNYALVSSETMDIADCDGEETIEVYTDSKNHSENSVVLFKSTDGQVLCTQDASLSRAGWNNIYLGSAGNTPMILTVHIEDRWNYGEFSYQAFRLSKEGSPVLLASSAFAFNLGEGSSTVYDDEVFKRWIAPLEDYLENSRLLISSQDGELRTEKISEADKYNYDTLSLKDRIPEINTSFHNCLIRFHDSWYSKRSLKKETVEWLLWYNSLSETEQLSVSSIAPELIDAKNLIEADTGEAYGKY